MSNGTSARLPTNTSSLNISTVNCIEFSSAFAANYVCFSDWTNGYATQLRYRRVSTSADVGGRAADATISAASYAFIGSPIHFRSKQLSGTPTHEIRARANADRAALTSHLPQHPAVDVELTSRERNLALEADRYFAPTLKNVLLSISAMSKSMVVRYVMKA